MWKRREPVTVTLFLQLFGWWLVSSAASTWECAKPVVAACWHIDATVSVHYHLLQQQHGRALSTLLVPDVLSVSAHAAVQEADKHNVSGSAHSTFQQTPTRVARAQLSASAVEALGAARAWEAAALACLWVAAKSEEVHTQILFCEQG